MSSPSSSSIANYYYREFLADDGESTDEEVEQEAVTSACQLAVRYAKHCSRPEHEVKTRDYIERDRRAANDRLKKDYFDDAPTFRNPEVFRRRFRMSTIDLYGARYLRTPTWDDLQKIYEVHSTEHGLPGMIGSLDCMHWRWDNSPTAWRGQHTRGDQKGPTVILQAVASQDLWVWSDYFGVVGSCNDINVLEDWISGRAPKASFYANENYYPIMPPC
ncbi:uncharacterized protein LOC110919240 [Helianthus annuus]|uniref:uncharacterized protein LOC110919240 n=1 Tax=Helianthus annuus TaxID=4232 RepID=UPI000B8F0F4A|nr:uncharacterized protein LOC110919240 [Helianthus annuus]